MNFREFIKEEGLKKLALTKLTTASYSLAIYLLNEHQSGIDEIIAARKELSLVLNWTEKEISDGLDELQFLNMLHITDIQNKLLRIKFNLEFENWNKAHTQLDSYVKNEINSDSQSQTSSVKDKVTLLNNHIDKTIPFPKIKQTKATKKNQLSNDLSNQDSDDLKDLQKFRQKNEIIDKQIKTLATNELDNIKKQNKNITADEQLLLQILCQHHEPKKQLILALQTNLFYPNLKDFLEHAKVTAGIQNKNNKNS